MKETNSNRLLPLSFIATAITGIGLHIASHGTDHESWHNWAMAHVVAGLLWLVAVLFHTARYRLWYRSIFTQGTRRKNRITLALSAVFLIEVISGIVLIAWVDGPDSSVGLWHYRFGLLLILLSFVHITCKKRKKPAS